MTALFGIMTAGILLVLVGVFAVLLCMAKRPANAEAPHFEGTEANNETKKPDLIDEGIRNILSFSANGNDGFGGRGEQDDR